MAKKDYTATREDYMTPAAIYGPILKMLKLDEISILNEIIYKYGKI